MVTLELPYETKLTWVSLNSHPLMPDTDGDGFRDDVDPRPLIFDQRDMLIHQSANREGQRKEPDPEHFRVLDVGRVQRRDYSVRLRRAL